MAGERDSAADRLNRQPENLLPAGQGDCRLVPGYLDTDQAGELFDALRKNVIWHQPEITVYGRKIRSPRLAAWYGDPNAIYSYSGIRNRPMQWLPELEALKQQLALTHQLTFNSVLINRYRDGSDGMGWHADDERELGLNPVIASISLGETRKFLIKHKTDSCQSTLSLPLSHGSLLLMLGRTQHVCKHSVPKTKIRIGERINLTYRMVTN